MRFPFLGSVHQLFRNPSCPLSASHSTVTVYSVCVTGKEEEVIRQADMTTSLAELMQERLSAVHVQQFAEQGWTVLKSFVEEDTGTGSSGGDNGSIEEVAMMEALGRSFLDDIKNAWDSNKFSPNKVEFLTSQGPIQLTKPNIYECDLHDAATREDLPAFRTLFNTTMVPLIETFNEKIPALSLRVPLTPEEVPSCLTLKLQINKGGCFPWHYDNPAPPNKRKLTMAVYLTEEWKQENGGEIVLMSFLGKPVAVPPRFVSIALFRSDSTMHRVLPARLNSTRYCFTIWFDSTNVNPDHEVNLRAKNLQEEFIPELRISPVQRALSRAVYDEEYRHALIDCFGGANSVGCKVSLQIHEAHIKPLKVNSNVQAFVEILRRLKVER